MKTQSFDNMKDFLAKALQEAIGLGAVAAKIGFSSAETTDCGFEAGRLKNTGSRQAQGYSMDVIVNGRRAWVSGNRVDQISAVVLYKSVAHVNVSPNPLTN